jgi:hypothetical protein
MRIVKLHTEGGHDAARYARVEVTTKDGGRLVRETDNVMYQKDGTRVFSRKQLRSLERMIADLEHLDDVAKLMAGVVPGAAQLERLSLARCGRRYVAEATLDRALTDASV